MENKRIIGLIGKHSLTRAISFKLEKRGFCKISLVEKVQEFASYFLPKDDVNKEQLIQKFREKAYKVNRHYWINLLLSSVNPECKNIVIDDLMEEDVVVETMDVYRITDENFLEVQKEIIKRELLK